MSQTRKWNQSLPGKIASMILVQILLSVIVGSFEYLQMQSLIKSLNDQLLHHLPANRGVLSVSVDAEKIRSEIYKEVAYRSGGLARKDPNDAGATWKEMETLLYIFNQSMKELGELDFSPEIKASFEQVKLTSVDYLEQVKNLNSVFNMNDNGNYQAALTKYGDSYAKFETQVSALGDQIESKAYESGLAARKLQALLKVLGLALIAVGILVAVTFGFFNMRSIMAQVRTLINALIDELERVSSGVVRLNQESLQLKSAATNISAVSQSLAQASTEQSSALQETASAIEETNAMIDKNAENSKASTLVASESVEVATKGQKAIENINQAMVEIDQSNKDILVQVLDSNRQITEIVRVIHEISEKTKVIDDIVFQTKLLSFNASVEAARAGEHGKGFAVVAEEVGNLAQMSGNAAKEISDMLHTSIEKVEDIVTDTKEKVESLVLNGKTKVEAGSKLVHQCGDILQAIVKNASDMNRMIAEIASASHEQSTGISEIAKAMGQLDQLTLKNTSTSQEAAESSELLLSQATALQNIVDAVKKAVHDGNHYCSELNQFVGKLFKSIGKQKLAKPSAVDQPSQAVAGATASTVPSAEQRGGDNVVAFAKPASPKVETKNQESQILKKAAGGENIPLKSDSRFEDI